MEVHGRLLQWQGHVLVSSPPQTDMDMTPTTTFRRAMQLPQVWKHLITSAPERWVLDIHHHDGLSLTMPNLADIDEDCHLGTLPSMVAKTHPF